MENGNDDPDEEDVQIDIPIPEVPLGNLLQDLKLVNAPETIFSKPTPSSMVLGEDYLKQEIGVDNIRESLIKKEEGKMSSPDKKRLIRVLMETKFVWSDLVKALALSLQMRPLTHIVTLVNQLGPEAALERWEANQQSLKVHVDALSEKSSSPTSTLPIAKSETSSGLDWLTTSLKIKTLKF